MHESSPSCPLFLCRIILYRAIGFIFEGDGFSYRFITLCWSLSLSIATLSAGLLFCTFILSCSCRLMLLTSTSPLTSYAPTSFRSQLRSIKSYPSSVKIVCCSTRFWSTRDRTLLKSPMKPPSQGLFPAHWTLCTCTLLIFPLLPLPWNRIF